MGFWFGDVVLDTFEYWCMFATKLSSFELIFGVLVVNVLFCGLLL